MSMTRKRREYLRDRYEGKVTTFRIVRGIGQWTINGELFTSRVAAVRFVRLAASRHVSKKEAEEWCDNARFINLTGDLFSSIEGARSRTFFINRRHRRLHEHINR